MIQNILTRRKEGDTYLATVSRHRWSLQIAMKVDKMFSFQLALWQSSSSADEGQVGVALFPSCILYNFGNKNFKVERVQIQCEIGYIPHSFCIIK